MLGVPDVDVRRSVVLEEDTNRDPEEHRKNGHGPRLSPGAAGSLDHREPVYEIVCMGETVRIDPKAHAALTEIARARHLSLTEALSRAVEAYRRQVFLDGLANDFAALRADSKAWAAERAEVQTWETTLGDGLEGD
jgi:hypothetical protein